MSRTLKKDPRDRSTGELVRSMFDAIRTPGIKLPPKITRSFMRVENGKAVLVTKEYGKPEKVRAVK